MPQTMREWEREAHTEFENERLNKPAPKCGVSRFVIAIEIAMFLPHSFLSRRHHEGRKPAGYAATPQVRLARPALLDPS